MLDGDEVLQMLNEGSLVLDPLTAQASVDFAAVPGQRYADALRRYGSKDGDQFNVHELKRAMAAFGLELSDEQAQQVIDLWGNGDTIGTAELSAMIDNGQIQVQPDGTPWLGSGFYEPARVATAMAYGGNDHDGMLNEDELIAECQRFGIPIDADTAARLIEEEGNGDVVGEADLVEIFAAGKLSLTG